MKKLLYSVVLVAASFTAGQYFQPLRTSPALVFDFDTVYLTDTCYISVPQCLESIKSASVTRRLPLAVRDSTPFTFDTVFDRTLSVPAPPDSADVIVPIVSKVYSDSNFRAVVSGFEPKLDSLVFYPKAIAGVPRKPISRWSLGITAGACVTPCGISPGITLGLTYSFATF